MKMKNQKSTLSQDFSMQFETLDSSQQAFCQFPDDAIRLLAPAGSGKTHSLLNRCLWLVQNSELSKPRLLLFTFTKAARDELRKRMGTQPFVNAQANLSITTLNSYGFKIIKQSMHNPRVISQKKEKYSAMQNTLQPIWMKPEFENFKKLLTHANKKTKAGETLFEISDTLKSLGFRHDKLKTFEEFSNHFEYIAGLGMGQLIVKEILTKLSELDIISPIDKTAVVLFHKFEELMPELSKQEPNLSSKLLALLRGYEKEVYENYIPFWKASNQHLFHQANITLEDQKYLAYLQIEKRLEAGEFTTGGGRFQHILVDEFQDINPLDLALLRAIAGINKAKITIAGDDDQAIFEWRGATPSYILSPGTHFQNHYKTIVLSTNYRSPRNIVELSKKLIEHNQNRVAKDFTAHATNDAHIEVIRRPTVTKAMQSTTELVTRLLKEGNRVALISRKRSQLIPYQITFASQNIPFCAAEDLQVFLSDAFRELKIILKIRSLMSAQNYYEPIEAFLTLCDKVKRYPLSKADRKEVVNYLKQKAPQTLAEACQHFKLYQGPLKGENADTKMSQAFANAIEAFLEAQTVSDVIQAISEHFDGLQKDYGKSIEDIFYTDPPFLYLAELAKSYGSRYDQFIADIDRAIDTLVKPTGDDDDNDTHYDTCWQRNLHLMTALRAKGKEFDAVIILDANQDIWPIKHAETTRQFEQERRLFYVAVTRAKKYLYFIVTDKILNTPMEVTPYLKEMDIPVPETDE